MSYNMSSKFAVLKMVNHDNLVWYIRSYLFSQRK